MTLVPFRAPRRVARCACGRSLIAYHGDLDEDVVRAHNASAAHRAYRLWLMERT
jgi:hypothetical protein